MRIETIRYTTFKGFTGGQRFAQVNLLTGPNSSGKSARLLGPMWAIMGRVPDGKLLQDASPFGSPRGFSVNITLDTGFNWERRLVIDPNTRAPSEKIELPRHEGVGVRACNPIIHQEVGNFAPMFNIAEFLNKSVEERRNDIMSLCAAAAGLDMKVAEELAVDIVIEFCRIEIGDGTVTEASNGHGGPVAELATNLKSRLSPGVRTALDSMVAALASTELRRGSITEAIAGALAKAKSLANSHNKDAKRETEAGRKLSDRKNQLTAVSESVDELRSRLTSLRAQREEVHEDMGLAEGRARSVADHRKGLDDCADGIKTASDALAAIVRPDEALVAREIARLNDEAELLEKIEEPARPSTTAIEEARGEVTAADKAVLSQSAEYSAASTSVASAHAQLAATENGPWMRCLAIAKQLGAPMGKAFSDHSDAKQLWGELASIIVDNADAATVESLRDAVRNAESEAGTAGERLSELRSARDSAQKQCEAATKAHAAAAEAFDAAHAAYCQAANQAAALRSQADELQRATDDITKSIETHTKDLEQLRAKQLGHESRLKALLDETSSESVDSMRQRADALATEIETLEAQVKAKEAYQQLEGELARCSAAAEQERVNHDTAKRLADAIRALRDRIMGDLVKPLAKRMNQFLGWCGLDARAYCRLRSDRGAAVFELGWVVDGSVQVSLTSMGGGESMIFTAALAYAIVGLADPPLKLLLLEIAEVDAPNLERLTEALVEVGKTGMQVIAATHIALPATQTLGGDVNVINCSAAETGQLLTALRGA